MNEATIVWTDYMRYRLELRGFDVEKVASILRHSDERYVDTFTDRFVAVGRHDGTLVMIPYERDADAITPVTIHVTTRRQINFRIKSGRFRYE